MCGHGFSSAGLASAIALAEPTSALSGILDTSGVFAYKLPVHGSPRPLRSILMIGLNYLPVNRCGSAENSTDQPQPTICMPILVATRRQNAPCSGPVRPHRVHVHSTRKFHSLEFVQDGHDFQNLSLDRHRCRCFRAR